MNVATAYWDRGAKNVPDMTGTKHVMDASDIPLLAAALGFTLPLGHVLDIGCGTGRIAKHCQAYLGAGIAPSAIEYCQQRKIAAVLIDGPEHLPFPAHAFDMVTCMSVFTHIDEPERVAYLKAFAKLAPKLMVGIIPGDGTGGIPMWSADTVRFESLLAEHGYQILGVTDRHANAGPYVHRYYYADVV